MMQVVKKQIGMWVVVIVLIGAAFGSGYLLERQSLKTEEKVEGVTIEEYSQLRENITQLQSQYNQLLNDKNTTEEELSAKMAELEEALAKYNAVMGRLLLIDGLGRTVTISETPERIISLASSVTETLYALNAGDLVVGRDKYSKYPEEVKNKTDVGSSFSLNVEMCVGLNPDIVFCWWYATSAIESLEDVGITTFAINPQSVDEVLQIIRIIGLIVNHTNEADNLTVDMQTKIDNITDITDNINKTNRPLVYYELSTPYKTLNHDTFTSDLIYMAGGINLAADEPVRYPILNSEYIIDRNPDVIVIISYGASIDEVKSRDGWGNITAIKSDRVYQIDTNWVTSNPRLVLGLEQFANWFHPDLFD